MQSDMDVLELGCGTGTTALKHAPHVASIVATDVSAAMINIGRDKAEQAGVENIHFAEAGVEEFNAPEGSFDMVLALNLLHLLPDRTAALTKIHQLLKPGGIFISSTPCLADRMWFLRPVIAIMQLIGKAPFVNFFGSKKLFNEMSDAGFVAQEHWTHGGARSLFMVATKVER